MDSTTITIAILVGIGTVVPFVWKYLLAKSATMRKWLDKTKLDEFAIGAVAETYDVLVRDAKAKAADGKLTKEEKKEALSHAAGVFKDLVKKDGFAAGKDLAMPLIKGLIEKAINKVKGEAKAGAKDEAPAA